MARVKKRFRGALLGLVSALLLVPPMAHAAGDPRFEIGVFTGIVVPDEDLIGFDNGDVEPTLGLRVGGSLARKWNWYVDAQYAGFETQTFAGEADMLAGRGGVEYLLQPGRPIELFYSAAWGYMDIGFDNATDFFSAFLSLGVGQHVTMGETMRLRWEARVDHTLAPDGLRGEDLTQLQLLIGLNWGVGGRRAAPAAEGDADGDGVADRRDRCPGTEAGHAVDRRGCSVEPDRDGDGVIDRADRCAGTAAGTVVDSNGCPADSDGDGVADASDACPATPAGAAVSAEGCPSDGDVDGVPDGVDRCPNTLRGIEVDETGCYLDADGDRVYDGLDMDKCPDTPKGAVVDGHGCPLDSDGDGVYDGLDDCPDTPPGTTVDDNGCPP